MSLLKTSTVERKGFWRRGRGTGVLLLSAFLAFGGASDLRPQNPPASEYVVKAAFIVNFAKFVEWPSSSFADDDSPLVIGILGEDPFGSALDQAISGKQVAGRSLLIRRWNRISQIEGCHLLFVSSSVPDLMSEVVEQFRNTPVLTVSDTNQFTDRGGMIRLALVDNKIRFEINNRSAREAKLKISSHLLSLALRVWE